jgi:hypothetical protein
MEQVGCLLTSDNEDGKSSEGAYPAMLLTEV